MRSVIAVGVYMAGPLWAKASRSWAVVSIFASMLDTGGLGGLRVFTRRDP
jgi:hypothetical protein